MLSSDDFDNSYTIEEYKTLREEILARVRIQAQLEAFSLTAAGVIWGAGFVKAQSDPSPWLGVCAGLVMFAMAILASYESDAIFKLGSFIAAKYEIGAPFGLTWESTTYTSKDYKRPKFTRHSVYFCLLMIVNVIITCVVARGQYASASLPLLVTVTIALAISYPVWKIECAYNSKEAEIKKRLKNKDEKDGDSEGNGRVSVS